METNSGRNLEKKLSFQVVFHDGLGFIHVQRPCYGLSTVLGTSEPDPDVALKIPPPLAVLGGGRTQERVIKNNSQSGAVTEPHSGLRGGWHVASRWRRGGALSQGRLSGGDHA